MKNKYDWNNEPIAVNWTQLKTLINPMLLRKNKSFLVVIWFKLKKWMHNIFFVIEHVFLLLRYATPFSS